MGLRGLLSGAGPRREVERRRLEAAKVVPIRLEEPLRPLHVEPRYSEVFLIVLSRGELVGRVRLPALSEIPVEVQRAAIASELGYALLKQEVREAVEAFAAPAPDTLASQPTVSVVIATRNRSEQ